MSSRLDNLRRDMADKELDALLISQSENRCYLSGFTGSAGYLLITNKESVLATDFRYTEQAADQSPDWEISQIHGKMSDWLPDLLAVIGQGKLGFEAGNVSFSMHRKLLDILDNFMPTISLVPVEGLVESLRSVKEPEEIRLIARAAEISDIAFNETAERIRPGMTEKRVAWELEMSLREHGSEKMSFEIIVASGPNSALPHARPTEREIQTGEPVVIDMGASVEGYCSDLSRTICPGSPDETMKQIYDTVLIAQIKAINGIEESMSGSEADALARTVIEEAGYGKAFGHSLGHGVGLAAHEEPRLGPNSEDTLKDGMVFSIEPGIYLSGWGGVRIEDLAVMENGKPRLLSKAKKMDSGG